MSAEISCSTVCDFFKAGPENKIELVKSLDIQNIVKLKIGARVHLFQIIIA